LISRSAAAGSARWKKPWIILDLTVGGGRLRAPEEAVDHA
jgi:hypothetical protein